MVENPELIRAAEAAAQEPARMPDNQQPVGHWDNDAARPAAILGPIGHDQDHLPAIPETSTVLELWPSPAHVPPQQPATTLTRPLSPHSQDLASCLHAGRVMDGNLAI